MPFGGLLTVGLIGAGTSLFSGIFGASKAQQAAQAQVAQEQKALEFQQSVYADQKANQQPFIGAGQDSIGRLMEAFKAGIYGPGSIADFKAPTLDEARSTPGYQFTQQQGELGIERGAAAAGGAFTGGTLKALANYDTGLADSTYSNVFNRALSTYQSQLQGQQQSYGQLLGVAGLGESAAAGLNANGTAMANTIGNTFGNIGNSQAAGIVGSANSLIGGISGAASSAGLPFYLQSLKASQGGGNGSGGPSGPYGIYTGGGSYDVPYSG